MCTHWVDDKDLSLEISELVLGGKRCPTVISTMVTKTVISQSQTKMNGPSGNKSFFRTKRFSEEEKKSHFGLNNQVGWLVSVNRCNR